MIFVAVGNDVICRYMGGSMLKEPENVLNHSCGDEICCL